MNEKEKEKYNDKCDMFMVSKEPAMNNKKKFIFFTAITIISIINIFNIPLNTINNNKSIYKNNEYIKNLKTIKEQNLLIKYLFS